MRNVRNTSLFVLVFFSIWCTAQNKKVDNIVIEAIEANTFPLSKGKVVLNDGRTEEGQLQYNALDRIIIMQRNKESKTYNPAKVAGFSFWDEDSKRERTYVTLPWENPGNSLMQPTFFEILREFKAFSLLSTRQVKEAYAKGVGLFNSSGTGIPIGTKTKIKYQETICFIDESGKLEPYLTFVDKEKDG